MTVAVLVTGGPGRRWRLSPLGNSFLAASAVRQVWLLLVTWWMRINWAIASPYTFEDGYMPDGFTRLTLSHLLDLSVGEVTPWESFAEMSDYFFPPLSAQVMDEDQFLYYSITLAA